MLSILSHPQCVNLIGLCMLHIWLILNCNNNIIKSNMILNDPEWPYSYLVIVDEI